ncbi:LamG domain-containing protein [Streptomyces sp. NPDC093252]|uniref:LamG domain-containing protein n=1 Tax=Streptomyces sp. NPDC093252 TaxID=3154980 RepID=UPI003417F962
MNRHERGRSWAGHRALLAGSLTAALAVAAPGAAQAATNEPPPRPAVADLRTGSQACATGAEPTYTGTRPTLSAVLHDTGPNSEVGGEFEARWTDASGAAQSWSGQVDAKYTGSTFRLTVPDTVPANTVVSWHVRALGATDASPWSSSGDGAFCTFVYDDTSPTAPAVTSTQYPADGVWRDGVGVYGDFTVDSPSDDVVSYVYSFLGGAQRTVEPATPGGPVTLTHLPTVSRLDRLTVSAIDRAGRSSQDTHHGFAVNRGRAPVAHWNLADPAGATGAAAETGPAARAGSGVTFGAPGPRGVQPASTASLDGTGHAFLTPDASVVPAGQTFAVSAWVRPARTDRAMTAASQDTGGTAGFTLGLTPGATGPAWSFAIGGTRVSGGAPETGEWAHLLGQYDARTGQARLYVNGAEAGTVSGATALAAPGDFQLGRAAGPGPAYGDPWQGELGGVRVHDRVVVPAEAAELARRAYTTLGRWALETAPGGASPEQGGGAPLTLGPGATIYRGADGSCSPETDPECVPLPTALVGGGHLALDGVTGHAVAAGPVVDTRDSFTLGVVVRLADTAPDRPMTVLSQAGTHTDVFKVRYSPADHAWQLVMPVRDEAGAPERVVSQWALPSGGQGPGHRLAVVYDDATDRISLYVNGSPASGGSAPLAEGLTSTGPLQIGRAAVGGGWGEYLRGAVDEVQAFAGALDSTQILWLGGGTDL